MDIVNRDSAPPFTTKDGSTIREILAYRNSNIRNQSLAEATLPVGKRTQAHFHPKTEEIYYILSGVGLMAIESEQREVHLGDGIAIPPGAKHQIANIGVEPLIFLCTCAPAYEHDDTVFCESLLNENCSPRIA
jgi:mannose-6-phosphate isomerase-like protein (cupin superfamily)